MEARGQRYQAVGLLFQQAKANPRDAKMWLYLSLLALRERQLDIAMQAQNILAQLGTSYMDTCIEGTPTNTILTPALGWFYEPQNDLYARLIEAGTLPVIFPFSFKVPTAVDGLTQENYATFLYKGVNLHEAALYELCIKMEKSVAELDLKNNGEQWEIFYTMCQQLASYINFLIPLVDFYRPQNIVFPQGYISYSSILRQVAIARNIPFVALENTLHKEHILYEQLSGISVNQNTVRNKFWRHKITITDNDADTFAKDYFKFIQVTKQGEHKAPQTKMTLPANNKKTAFYIGQVFTDSSILFGIRNGFINQTDVITNAVQAALDKGHRIIIKLHPKEKNGNNPISYTPYNQLTLRRLQQHPDFVPYLNHPDVIIDSENRYDTYDIIDKADYCITINSQAGLEALLKGKEVILCGNSFYGGMGWTYDAYDSDDIAHAIDKITHGTQPRCKMNKTDIQKFFYSYLNHSCIKRDLDTIVRIYTGR